MTNMPENLPVSELKKTVQALYCKKKTSAMLLLMYQYPAVSECTAMLTGFNVMSTWNECKRGGLENKPEVFIISCMKLRYHLLKHYT